MIIDFHTHIFPDKIAQKTITLLSEKGGIPPFSDGSVNGLLHAMAEAGVDVSITLPVLTNPGSFESVNRFAAAVNAQFAHEDRRLISFGAIHPACEDLDGKMRWIKENGFLGVKIHPDYQGTLINGEGYVRILECAREYDLIVLTHAGLDAAYPDTVHCPPVLAKELIRRVPHTKFVLAHCGGNEMQEQVLDLLCGEDVYLDTAYVLRFISEEFFKALLRRHGEDRILFATDSPWSDVGRDVEIMKSYSLPKNTEEKIFSLNAKKLLGI